MPVTDYSTTPSSNAAISGINIAEGCPPGSLNDAIRQQMADMAGWRTGSVATLFTAGGTMAGAYTFSGAVTFSSTISFSAAIPVGSGGTGVATLTNNRLLRGAGTSAVAASLVQDDGSNISIGTTVSDARFRVSAIAALNAPVLGNAAGASVCFSNNDLTYGLVLGTAAGDGHVWMQSQRTNGMAIAFNLTLNEAGGNVGIGLASPTSTLHVSGTVNFTGALTSGALADAVGFKGLPQNARTASYTLALADMAYDIYISGTTAAQTVTIPANASVAFPVGSIVQVTNDSNQNWSIAITTDTLLWSPSGGTGSRTLAAGGQATLRKVTATRWWISGTGLT